MSMEKVLVVPTEVLQPKLGEKSFLNGSLSEIIELIKKEHIYADRAYAETASEYKQIIPYAVLTDGTHIYMTKRLKGQTEKRLHGKGSIGLGGHINPSEEKYDDVIMEGMKRELSEEVGLTDLSDCRFAGIINDLSTEVSNYHIGLVFVIHTTEDIRIKETEKMTGAWETADGIDAYYEYLESWSQIVWDNRKLWM